MANSTVLPIKWMLRLEGVEIPQVMDVQVTAGVNTDVRFNVTIPAVPGVQKLVVNTVGELFFRDYTTDPIYKVKLPNLEKGDKISDKFKIGNKAISIATEAKQGDLLSVVEYKDIETKLKNKISKEVKKSSKADSLDEDAVLELFKTYFEKEYPWRLMCIGELDSLATNRTAMSVSCNLSFTGILQNLNKAYIFIDTVNGFVNKVVQGSLYGLIGEVGRLNLNKGTKLSKDAYAGVKYTGTFVTEVSGVSVRGATMKIADVLANRISKLGAWWQTSGNLPGKLTIISGKDKNHSECTVDGHQKGVAVDIDLSGISSRNIADLKTELNTSFYKDSFISYLEYSNPKRLHVVFNFAAYNEQQKNLKTEQANQESKDKKDSAGSGQNKTLKDLKGAPVSEVAEFLGTKAYISEVFKAKTLAAFWQKFSIQTQKENPYVNLMELRFPTLRHFEFIDNAYIYKNLNQAFFANKVLKEIQGMGGVSTMMDILQLIFEYLNYSINPQLGLTPRYKDNKVVGLNSYTFAPESDFLVPPSCNVVFESEILSSNLNRNFGGEITRATATHRNLATKDNNLVTTMSNLQYFAPNESVRSSKAYNIAAYSNEEILKGINPAQLPLSDMEYALEIKTRGASKIKELSDKNEEEIKEVLNTDGNVDKLSKFYQSFVDYKYPMMKYASRTVGLNLKFNPYLMVGMPLLVVDRLGSYIGKLVSVSHSYSAEGNLSTGASITNVRYLEDKMNSIFYEGYDYYLDSKLQGRNINNIYQDKFNKSVKDIFTKLNLPTTYTAANNDPDITLSELFDTSTFEDNDEITLDDLMIIANQVLSVRYNTGDIFERRAKIDAFKKRDIATIYDLEDMMSKEYISTSDFAIDSYTNSNPLNKILNGTNITTRMADLKTMFQDTKTEGLYKTYYATRKEAVDIVKAKLDTYINTELG